MVFQELIRKALTTDPSVFKFEVIDPIIADMLNYENPLRQNLPRKKGSGSVYTVKRRQSLGTSGAAWVSDTDSISEATGTYSSVSFEYKTIATRGRVSRKLIAEGKDYFDLLSEEIEAKTNEFKVVEEDAYINANAVDTEPKKPLGLIKQLSDTGRVINLYSGGASAALTLQALDRALDECKGTPSLIIMSKAMRRKLQSLLQVYQRWIDKTEVKGGFRVLAYNEIPVLVSSAISDEYQVNASGIVGLTGGDSSAIFVINTDEVFVAELTPVTIQPLAKTTTQYDEFEIVCDETLVLRNPETCVMVIGVNPHAE